MPKSRKRQNLTGLRLGSSSRAYDYGKKRYRSNIFGYVDRQLPLGIMKHNSVGEKSRFVEDFSRLPASKKNEVIKFFNDYPNAKKVYLLESVGVKKSNSVHSTKKSKPRKPKKAIRWFGGKGKRYKATKATTLQRRGNKFDF